MVEKVLVEIGILFSGEERVWNKNKIFNYKQKKCFYTSFKILALEINQYFKKEKINERHFLNEMFEIFQNINKILLFV